jgi:hypothetical protein
VGSLGVGLPQIQAIKRPCTLFFAYPFGSVMSLTRIITEKRLRSNGHAKKFLRLNNVRGVGP